jgi:hypothetical protein
MMAMINFMGAGDLRLGTEQGRMSLERGLLLDCAVTQKPTL